MDIFSLDNSLAIVSRYRMHVARYKSATQFTPRYGVGNTVSTRIEDKEWSLIKITWTHHLVASEYLSHPKEESPRRMMLAHTNAHSLNTLRHETFNLKLVGYG